MICLNVLEHLAEEDLAVANLRAALRRDGHAVVLVPQGPSLFGTMDEALAEL